MKQIKLSQGRVALVDDEDFVELGRFHWFYQSGFAVRSYREDGWRKQEHLHRAVMKPERRLEVIFLDGDRLNCCRSNLRVVTTAQARARYRRGRRSASGFRGVYRHKSGKWTASIRHEWRLQHLGLFDSPEEAAKAYDLAAKELLGAMAALNFPDGLEGQLAPDEAQAVAVPVDG